MSCFEQILTNLEWPTVNYSSKSHAHFLKLHLLSITACKQHSHTTVFVMYLVQVPLWFRLCCSCLTALWVLAMSCLNTFKHHICSQCAVMLHLMETFELPEVHYRFKLTSYNYLLWVTITHYTKRKPQTFPICKLRCKNTVSSYHDGLHFVTYMLNLHVEFMI